MSISKHSRITKSKLKRQYRKARKASPSMRNLNLTKVESAICNTMQAYSNVAESHEMRADYIRLIIWLYQFEFFEKSYVLQNYSYMSNGDSMMGERHASMCLTYLIRNGYVELYEKREAEYREEEDRFGYVYVKMKKSDDSYRLSDKALDTIVKDFFTEIFNTKPLRWGTRNRIMIWSSQKKSDLNDYQDY